jgi:hypothetical protein
MRHRLLLLFVFVSGASAATIEVSSKEFVEFRQGSEFWIEYPYPDLEFLDHMQPSTLYWFIAGRQQPLPPSSYEFSATLQSLDGATSIGLPNAFGTPTTLCLDNFLSCTVTEPGMIFIFQYESASGLASLVGLNDVPDLPALWLIVRNEGPSLSVGIPGGTLGGFGLTWGNAEGKGVVTTAEQFLLSDIPEPNTLALVLTGLLALSTFHRKRSHLAPCGTSGCSSRHSGDTRSASCSGKIVHT